MKKGFIISIMLLSFQLCAFAQHKISIKRSCGFSKEDPPAEGYAWGADNQALEYIKRICQVSGISKNFTVERSSATATACALIDFNNNRIIYYNQHFFASLGDETYKIAILAHEIAHHLNNNLFTKDSNRAIDELDADKFAGSVICKLGLKLEDAKGLYLTQCPAQSTGLYPAQSDRIDAFSIGFNDAGCQNTITPKLATKSAETGDFCFQNADRVGYKATVTILKEGKNGAIKTISVSDGEKQCVYELEAGVYTVNISWSDRWSNNIPSTTQQIRVRSGVAGTLALQH
ncbi:M48 family metalloprotease [Mucilaginibacter ginsenosidivorans]|uniref:M48 family metalloprotease n=1 Tax=Mucilaginibacter ginsenosidivorans TaxID=398053 RepID=A0A5B8UTZ2_9SPHI|nr:hypothetical protein [Mucilaginibacter ginsenosidivorans]QEC62514.1 hypothetical protein FRZ54_07900 [Mucilaginibacter ginsenosidivorans]